MRPEPCVCGLTNAARNGYPVSRSSEVARVSRGRFGRTTHATQINANAPPELAAANGSPTSTRTHAPTAAKPSDASP
jgi:hypothetical protein